MKTEKYQEKWDVLARAIGQDLLKNMKNKTESIFNKTWWYKKLLSWTMKNDSLKTRLFHFIDVLPSLKTSQQIVSHLKEYFKDEESAVLFSGVQLGGLTPALTANIIKKQINEMAKIFITGSTAEEALKAVKKMRGEGVSFTIDFLGEAIVSEKEAQKYQTLYLNLMDSFIQDSKKWKEDKNLDNDNLGQIPSVNISIKATSLYSQIKLEAWEQSKEKIKDRLRPIFKKASENFIFLNLDMEQYEYKTLTLEIFKELLMEFKDYPHFGLVIQAYLKDSFSDLEDLIQFSKKRGQPFTIRLVKGAYWDSEVLNAKQKNWPIPVWIRKEDTDANYERCLRFLFKNYKEVKLAVGSHNVRSVAVALALHEECPKACLEFQTLYGMGDALVEPLKRRGYSVRFYTTVGELIPGMSYLVRRLLENTANQSFIRESFVENKDMEKLLSQPVFESKPSSESKKENRFMNHPLLDFSFKENRDQFLKALSVWKARLPVSVPIVIDGKEETSPQILNRENPSRKEECVSKVHLASLQQAERAVKINRDYFDSNKSLSQEERVKCLRTLASLISEKEFLFSALEVFEVGKTWSEAQADVAEAIDFCNYYAASFSKLSVEKKTDEVAGEKNVCIYEPIGVCAVIAPWNFPLAILVGMVVAPLVCGNPVVIKPAEQSSLIAYEFIKLLLESGFSKRKFFFPSW